MAGPPRGAWVFAVLLAVLGGVFPPVLYWLVFDRVPEVLPEEAAAMLAEADSQAVLVDVRSAERFRASHIEGAVSWPWGQIAKAKASDLPPALRGRTLLLLCNAGMESATALKALRRAGLENPMFSVRGGMQLWVGAAGRVGGEGFPKLRTASGELTGYPCRQASAFEQWAIVVTGFGIKPLYMLISLVLVWVLRRQRDADLAALRWGLLCFFLGEAFCATNYLAFGEQSLLAEYLHCYGMVLCFGLVTYALLEGLDLRVVRYSDPDQRCAALSLCRGCIKHGHPVCRLQQLFVFIILAQLVLALMPLGAELKAVSYNTRILGTPYNYVHFVPHQLYETRVCPLVALPLFAASFLALRPWRSVPWSKVLFAAGMGFFGFGMFRLVLFQAYDGDLFWFVSWEEWTELLFMAGVAVVLWLFRGALLRAGPE